MDSRMPFTMRRASLLRRFGLFLPILFALGPGSSSASAAPAEIVPGSANGQVKVGMSLSQVERVLGKDHIAAARTIFTARRHT
jgi:hypothetical protein